MNSASRLCFCGFVLIPHVHRVMHTRSHRGNYQLLHFPSFSIKLGLIVRRGTLSWKFKSGVVQLWIINYQNKLLLFLCPFTHSSFYVLKAYTNIQLTVYSWPLSTNSVNNHWPEWREPQTACSLCDLQKCKFVNVIDRQPALPAPLQLGLVPSPTHVSRISDCSWWMYGWLNTHVLLKKRFHPCCISPHVTADNV